MQIAPCMWSVGGVDVPVGGGVDVPGPPPAGWLLSPLLPSPPGTRIVVGIVVVKLSPQFSTLPGSITAGLVVAGGISRRLHRVLAVCRANSGALSLPELMFRSVPEPVLLESIRACSLLTALPDLAVTSITDWTFLNWTAWLEPSLALSLSTDWA